METLPPEVVEIIARHLTPEDLAHCIAVTHRWRNIFDQDYLWKPHCDPALDVLRTIPSVVRPVFVTPQVEGSTLPPICKRRLSLLRERHLWRNLKQNKGFAAKLAKLKNEVHIEFLADTLIVRWCTTHIEVWDVSPNPVAVTFVAKTDPSVYDIAGWIKCSVVGRNLLVIVQKASMKVFYVNVASKNIKLKHVISFDNVQLETSNRFLGSCSLKHCRVNCIKGHILVHVNASRSSLDIFDLQTGKKIKEELCPVVEGRKEVPRTTAILTSESSDYVVVNVFYADPPEDGKDNCYYYIYSPEKLCFLPGPVTKIGMEKEDGVSRPMLRDEFTKVTSLINGKYLAVQFMLVGTLTVYDCHSLEVVFKTKRAFCPSIGLNSSFIWSQMDCVGRFLRIFTPSSKTVNIFQDWSQDVSGVRIYGRVRTYNNKLVLVLIKNIFRDITFLCLMADGSIWKTSNQITEFNEDCWLNKSIMSINHSFTRELGFVSNWGTESSWFISYSW